ncbi:sulfite exporter TauE/SafE family protein [Bacillus sp. DJP31]|uniref:sulfite exporter TauE/SafE family protein n=1 Tax=Bacillus sp. DJP31 TaxID=3409789 RepID=UPI003BB4BD40
MSDVDILLLILIGLIGTFIGTLAGGGGLISMPSMLLMGVPIHSAIAATKFSNTLSSFSSFYVLFRQKKIDLKTAIFLAPLGISGGITGGLIATSISEKAMTTAAVFLLSFALVLSFIRKPKGDGHSTTKVSRKVYPLLYGIGIYDGMFGPGQATLQMYTYLHNGFSYLSAIALTRFLTFSSCLGAFSTYFLTGHLNWRVAPSLAVGSFIGAQLSVRVAGKLSSKHLQFILRALTVLLLVQLMWNLLN